MRRAFAYGVFMALLVTLVGARGETPSSGEPGAVEREIRYELGRLSAKNVVTRARASDTLKRLSADPTNHEALRAGLETLKRLLDDPQPIVRWNAIVVLVRIGDDATVKAAYSRLEADARDPLYSTRLGVIDTVQEIGLNERTRVILGILAQDEDEEVRAAATAALAPAERRAPWEEEATTFDPAPLFDPSASQDARLKTMEALLRLTGPPWNRDDYVTLAPQLIPLLEDETPALRWGAAVVLTRLTEDEETIGKAVGVFAHDATAKDPQTRLAMLDLLGEVESERADAILTDLARQDPDRTVRATAQEILTKRAAERQRRQMVMMPPPGAMPPFAGTQAKPATSEPEPETFLRTVQDAVRRLPSDDALATLADATLMSYRDGIPVDERLVPMADLFGPAVVPLMRWLREKNPPPMARRNAAKILGVAGEEAVAALVAALEDPEPEVRAVAAFALMWGAANPDGQPRSEGNTTFAADALVFSLADESAEVRAYAAIGLGKMQATAYRDDVILALQDPDPCVRAAAARSDILDAAAREEAIRVMRNDLASDDRREVLAALEALAVLKPSGVRKELVARLSAEEPSIAYAAAAALVSLGEPPPLMELGPILSDARLWIRLAAERVVAGARPDFAWEDSVQNHGEGPASALSGRVLAGAGWRYFSTATVSVPLVGATVSLSGPRTAETTTDVLGRFRLADAPAGVYNLRIEAPGYVPFERTVSYNSDKPEPWTFFLERLY